MCLTYANSDWNLCIPVGRDPWIAIGPSRPPVPALATTCKTLCTLDSTKLEISLPTFQHTMLRGNVMCHLFCKALSWKEIAWQRRDFGPCQCIIYADLAPGQPPRNDMRFWTICLHFKYYWNKNKLSLSWKNPGDWTCLTYVKNDCNLCIPVGRDAWIAMGPSRPPEPALVTTCKTLCTLHSTQLEISLLRFQHTMLRGYVMCHLFYKALTWRWLACLATPIFWPLSVSHICRFSSLSTALQWHWILCYLLAF